MRNESTFVASGYTGADVQLFRGADDIDAIIADCPILRFAAGESVPASINGEIVLYIVLQGALAVLSPADNQADEYDDVPTNTEIRAGECVGEIAILNGERRGMRVEAKQITDALVLDTCMLWKVIDASSGFARNLLMLPSLKDRALNAQSKRRKNHADYYRQVAMLDNISGL